VTALAFPVLLDTCALYPQYLCDFLLRLAEHGVFRPLWSADIMAELERNLVEKAGIHEFQVRHRLSQMNVAFVDATISEHRSLIPAMTCDEKDRHVLAAAVHANAAVLVTFNTRDFPPASVEPYEIEVTHPDEFLLNQLDLFPEPVRLALTRQARAMLRPPMSPIDLLEALARCGVPEFAGALKATLRDGG
jgi:predicted nucleic acid-binding protein